jgi:dienelactone hydrolase
MRFLMAFLLTTLFATSSYATIIVESIDYKHGKVPLRGTLAYDDSITSPKPGILMVPEWWGHNDYIKQRAREMAERGYVVFAIDMYGADQVTDDAKVAEEWSKPFYENRDLMKRRARAGLDVLLKQKNVDKKKIAAIGFCMGGTVALELARSGENLRGVVAFHAGLKFPDKPVRGDVKAKVLVLNGGADPMVPPEDRESFILNMQNAGADLQFMQYGGAVHAFTNPRADKYKIKGVAYNKKATIRAFKAMDMFLEEAFKRHGD